MGTTPQDQRVFCSLLGPLIAFALVATGLQAAADDETGRTASLESPDWAAGPITLAGTPIRINGCDALDVYEGPEGLTAVSLRWRRPPSRQAWLQRRFDARLGRYDGDLWRAFVELGGGLRQSASGVAVEAHATGERLECGSFELPVLEVDEVLGVFDPRDQRRLDRDVRRLARRGLDTEDGELSRILAAAQSAREGAPQPIDITIEGVTDLSLGCPAWALVATRPVTFDCAPRWGFVEVRYASPELEPDPDRALFELLLQDGRKSVDGLRASEVERLRERADWRARRGPYRYTGHFSGEITLHRGTEAIFLTPVFVAERLVVDEPGESRHSD